MTILLILLILYLILGFIYAVNILLKGIEPISTFPINMLGGPVVYVLNRYWLLKNGEYPKR